jgi:CxxC-x17-CxxC domain-containing protein
VAPSTPRPERPKFDITCGACGIAAQVPFKPIEGREVFCQECYRARRGTARPETEVLDVATDSDGGIVE